MMKEVFIFPNNISAERIPGCDDYFITKTGKVYSTIRGKIKKLTPSPDSDGYLVVSIVIDGKRKLVKLHKLLLMTFNRMPKPGEIARHFDDNKMNNGLENLFWGTSKDNYDDMVRNGTRFIVKGEQHGNSKLNELQVRIIRRCTAVSTEFLSKVFSVEHAIISSIRNYVKWKHLPDRNIAAWSLAKMLEKSSTINFVQYRVLKRCHNIPVSYLSDVFGVSARFVYLIKGNKLRLLEKKWGKIFLGDVIKQRWSK